MGTERATGNRRPATGNRQPVLLIVLLVATTAGAQNLSDEELRVLDEVEDVGERYREAARAHAARMRGILRAEYGERLREIEARHAERVGAADARHREAAVGARRRIEAFLAKYPDDPRWTPDAMFRLADLMLDEAKLAWDEKEAALAAAPPAEEDLGELPAYVGPDFSPSIEIWRDLASRFPDYRQLDGTVYLLGYYLGEMRRVDEAKQALRGLVCRNRFDPLAPPARRPTPAEAYEGCEPLAESRDLVDESWVRLGEIHFDARGELPLAIAAYRKVAGDPRSKLYDVALYKLAWSYYRNDQFLDGIRAFDELVVYSDRMEDEGKPRNDLRGEAVQYLAISFADPWEADALADPEAALERAAAFYRGREKERHVRDVYEQLGDVLRLSAGTATTGQVPPEIAAAYRSAIAAWRFALDGWPLHPKNPLVQQKIVDALAFMGDAAGAAVERARLAESYRKGSAWYAANESNPEAMELAGRRGEGSLLDAARTVHRNAQLAKAEHAEKPTAERRAKYLLYYAQAAQLYKSYLAEYPESSQAYELTYRLADTLFFSEQYLAAVPYYRWVRDHRDLGTAHHDEAVGSIVKAYEAAVDKAVREGELVEPPVPTPEALAGGGGRLRVPPLYPDLRAAYDEYVEAMKDATVPAKALAAAMISYRHRDVDDSLRRFDAILDRHCRSAEAVQAKEGLLAIYQSRRQHENFEATADRFIRDRCGASQADVELAATQKMSNEYRIASQHFADGKYGLAAEEFYAVYKTTPASNEDRPGALFNAALAYERAGKPKTAVSLYQELTRVPELQKSEYYVEALFRSAVAYQNAFDYERAVDTFLEVVAEAQERGRTSRPEFDLDDARLDAMFNAALLRDLDRVYRDRGRNDPGAATLYERYAAAETRDRARASQAFFNAALVHEKAGDTREMIRTFEEWRKEYGRDPGSGYLRVLAQHKMALALEVARDPRRAEEHHILTIRAFDESGEAPGSPAAELAAEAQFRLAERYYKTRFEPYKVKWLGNIASRNQKVADKAVLDTVSALQKVARDTSAAYEAVARFEASWSLPAIVRLGDVAFFTGQKLLEAPVPREIVRLDRQYPDQGVLASYQTALEAQVAPNTDAARGQWLKALETAKRAGVANEWSKLAAQRLNAYIAADLYPMLRDELVDREESP